MHAPYFVDFVNMFNQHVYPACTHARTQDTHACRRATLARTHARMLACNTDTYTCTHEHMPVRTHACNTETYPCTHATLARLHAHNTRRKTHVQPIRACTLC